MSLLTFVSLCLMAVALPFAMGRDAISPAARYCQRYFMLQAMGWISIVIASRWRDTPWDVLCTSLATVAVAGAHWSMGQALAAWLGPRQGMQWLKLCCITGPLGFMLLWSNVAWRFSWFSTVQACGLMLLVRMCIAPHPTSPKGWRVVLCTCATVMAAALLLRVGIIQLQPQLLPDFAAQTWLNHGFVVLAHICTTLTLVSVLVAWREESHQKLRELALTDMLTGAANRRSFESDARALLTQARRRQSPVALMLLDIDFFKQINDRHGHAVGDQALRTFTRTVQVQLRDGDLFARWGGEEFCLLVHAAPEAVQALYARLRKAVETQSLKELGFAMQFSAGAAQPAAMDATLEEVLLRADAALYHAKQTGRGKLVYAEDAPQARTDGVASANASFTPPPLAPATHAEPSSSAASNTEVAPAHASAPTPHIWS